ncbi:MAG: hypothetical protein KIS65_00085 [Nitrosomonas sp.]|nr:hypothetical protein [Nitrosomonas sp.]
MKQQAGSLSTSMKVGSHMTHRVRTVMRPLARDVMARMTGRREAVSTRWVL